MHLADPGAAMHETRMNREYARQGLKLRMCLHADVTLEFRTGKDGRRTVVCTCDYCPSRATGLPDSGRPGLWPWAYRTD